MQPLNRLWIIIATESEFLARQPWISATVRPSRDRRVLPLRSSGYQEAHYRENGPSSAFLSYLFQEHTDTSPYCTSCCLLKISFPIDLSAKRYEARGDCCGPFRLRRNPIPVRYLPPHLRNSVLCPIARPI
jgi:hypothetical protein